MALILMLHGHRFRLSGISREMLPANTLLFCKDNDGSGVDFSFEYHFVEELPIESALCDSWRPVYQKRNIKIWRKGLLERRQLMGSSASDSYAIYEETSASHADIWFANALRKELVIDTIFISTLSLERHLAPSGSYILHCAFMSHKGDAILLSGPSGTGKSTHATLWEQAVDGTHAVNGDRCLISVEKDGTYTASGWPVCGSSFICNDESHPIRAIVFIDQTPDNHIIAEPAARLFVRLFSQITVNHWDAEATSAAADWTEELMRHIPVMVYGCNMDADAPLPLYRHIYGADYYANGESFQQTFDDTQSWH